LTSGAPIPDGFPARHSGRDQGAAIGTWGARRPWDFMKAASGADSRAQKKYIKMLINIPRFSPQSTQRSQSLSTVYINICAGMSYQICVRICICGFYEPGSDI
jgi:hypothetical protein